MTSNGSWLPNAPNPGSDKALTMGCKCAVLDNHHGHRGMDNPYGWWITVGCPVHNVITVLDCGCDPATCGCDVEVPPPSRLHIEEVLDGDR